MRELSTREKMKELSQIASATLGTPHSKKWCIGWRDVEFALAAQRVRTFRDFFCVVVVAFMVATGLRPSSIVQFQDYLGILMRDIKFR